MRLSALFLWSAVLHASIGSYVASAMPFAIDLTIPEAHGWVLSKVPGNPNTPFTAPYIVVRVTGDTANVIGQLGSSTTVYQASTMGISIPGIGSGTAPSPDLAETVSSGYIEFQFPAYPTVFNSGASASDPALAEYALQSSLGPIPVQDARTFSFGPTSAMIGFTTDDGLTGTVAAGRVPGGVLQITVGGNAANPVAAKPYTNSGAFLYATGPNSVATFEDAANESSGGVLFSEGLLQIVESLSVLEFPNLVDQPHPFWFGSLGSQSHFALNTGGGGNLPATTRFEAVFPADVVAAGFLFNCFTCDLTPKQYGIVWTTRDAVGNTLEHGTTIVELSSPTGTGQPRPGFFGLTTTKAFRGLTVAKHSPFADAQPWVIDDLRYATTLTSSPPRLIEYYHAAFNHYFVTSIADEVTKLDNGTFAGWVRTGLEFNASTLGLSGTAATCRFFSTTFASKSSHFYTSNAEECGVVKENLNWQYEGEVFGVALPEAAGNCTTGTIPLYRLYNNGQGGAPNHRYTTSASARQTMLAMGWIPEAPGC